MLKMSRVGTAEAVKAFYADRRDLDDWKILVMRSGRVAAKLRQQRMASREAMRTRARAVIPPPLRD